MKHHFADFLNRDHGHWKIVPNRERWKYGYADLKDAPTDVSILSISKDVTNWERISEFKNLEELTLHEPSKEQVRSLNEIHSVKRLRISHFRPKNLDFLKNQKGIEELILEYISGFDDLTPISRLPQLKSLHLENLRRVRDFSPLSAAPALRYLHIDGTLDWDQPIHSLDFLQTLEHLEYFGIGFVKLLGEFPVFAGLLQLKHIKQVRLGYGRTTLDNYAYFHAKAPQIEGAVQEPFRFFEGENRLISENDYRAKMDEKRFLSLDQTSISDDGSRYYYGAPHAFLLGRGDRDLRGKAENILAKCEAYKLRYETLLEKFRR